MRRVVLAVAALSLASALDAGGPRFWRLEGTADFLEGELESISLDSEARLRLGPGIRTLFDPELPNAWCVARGPGGVLYVGTGNDGRVFRVPADGEKGEVLFDADELEAYAVAVAPGGEVYAATSPDGAVYAISADGSSRVFFDPEETYIWALAFDGEGRLLVATGAEGRVHRVRPDGSAEVILESAETHILSLALGAEGRVFAGSAPSGMVYRIGAGGDVFVLVDSPFREIKGLVVDADGGIFAAAVNGGGEPADTAPSPAPAPSGPPTVAQVTVTETFTVVQEAAAPTSASGASQSVPRGAVLHIDATGSVDTLWSSNEDVPHALAASGRGVLVGTGDKAKLYRVERDARWTLLAMPEAQQVTGIIADASGAPALVTSNPARVLALTGRTAAEGHLVSEVHDAGTVASWGRLRWEGTAPEGTGVRLETRSGNSSSPDTTWGEWTEVAPPPSRGIRSESARFLQIRLTLTDGAGATPTVEALSAAYLQRNLRPRVTSVTLHPPGEVFQKPISVSGEPEILGLDADPLEERRNNRDAPPPPSPTAFGRKLYQRGLRTFGWTADDPNGDLLTFAVEYRAVGDDQWRPLRREIAEPVLAWDTSAVPDGRYLVRVTATDAPDNPPSLALKGHKDSASFEVDNAPPTLTASLVEGAPPTIRAVARDAGTPIRRLEISVDAGRWNEVYPIDGINDSREETYQFPVPTNGGSGPRVVVLRVSDRLGNVATGRVDVR